MTNTFGARSTLKVGNRTLEIFRLDALAKAGFDVQRLPYSLRILLENLLRTEDGIIVTADDVEHWRAGHPRVRPGRSRSRPRAYCSRILPAYPR